MTTNHPEHGPVSLDRLHQISEILSKAAAQSDSGNLGYAMADAVKVIDGAIAAFGAEPVAWKSVFRLTGQPGSDFEKIFENREAMDTVVSLHERGGFNVTVTPLYTAPPALVVPLPDAVSVLLNHLEDVLPDDAFNLINVKTWNAVSMLTCPDACRAAMLQGNHRDLSQPVDPQIAEYEKVMLQAGNSPVTPDCWQLVPKEPTEAMNKAGWAAINEHDAINPTYRAMLAAAPQQEVKLALEIGMSRYAGVMQKLADAGD